MHRIVALGDGQALPEGTCGFVPFGATLERPR
jgi:hypothetical protein